MKANIEQFLACKKFAIAGVSQQKNKFGNTIYRTLKQKSYDIVPVNPILKDFEGDKCYPSVKDLPGDIDAIIISVNPDSGISVIKEAKEKGISNVFLQQGAQSDEILKYASDNGINIICKQCILMFANPAGIHKFHERLAKFFGFYPN